MAVTKSELIGRLLKKFPHLGQRGVDALVNKIFSEISDGLANGDRVELRGFGAFSLRTRDPRTARNPKNGASVKVSERHSIYFRAGKELREKLNKDA
jgi:integration host factor subunit beta